MNFVQLAIPFFILALFIEFAYGFLVKRQTYRLGDTINSLQLGVLSRLVGILRLGFSAMVISWLIGKLGVVSWSPDHWTQWVLSFIAYDFCYYWKHRFGHQWRIMWASHVAHHQSQDYNLSTALRQTSTDYVGFVFYLPLYLLGTSVEVIIGVGSLNLVYQFWVHTEHVRTLGVLDYLLVTPANHRVHHAVNEGYLDKNYGGVFIIWDRLFGTFVMEEKDKPCVYGIRHPLNSYNPIWANFHIWWETFWFSVRVPRVKEKFLSWFRSPAWAPGNDSGSQDLVSDFAKYSPSSSIFEKSYTFVQFWIFTGLALALQANHLAMPRDIVLIAFAWLIASVLVQSMWLEGRRYSHLLEWIRLSALSVFCFAAPLIWPMNESRAINSETIMVFQSICIFSGLALVLNWLVTKSGIKLSKA